MHGATFRLLLLCGLMLPVSSWAAEKKPAKPAKAITWLSRVTGQPVGPFPAPRPLHATWRGTWAGITGGQIEGHFSVVKNQLRLQVKGGTIGLARVLFLLDTDFDSWIDRKTLQPTQTRIFETYSDEKRETIQKFDRKGVTRIRQTKPAQKDDGKPKTVHLPDIFDLQGALLYIRSQPLHRGDQVVFIAYATGSPYLVTVSVDGPETITVPAGKYPAIRLSLKLESIEKNLQLKPYQKASEVMVWLSDDSDRLFLKIQSELWVGAATVELEKAEFLKP